VPAVSWVRCAARLTRSSAYPAGASPSSRRLYRLRDPAELDTLGLRDWAQPGHLWLIEWPERGAGHLPAPDLTIQLTIGRQAHALDLAAPSDLGQQWLQDLQRG
jgi:tRNA threonylcarbamoyladenosine biosynthesis protein TsaE